MNEFEYVSYLAQKVKFGDMAKDIRWETFSSVFIRECKKAKLVADCGAELGFYIHLVRHSSAACNVVAFEPEPPRFEALKEFFCGHESVVIHPYALSNQAGLIQIHKAPGRSATIDSKLSQWEGEDKIVFDVPTITLDEVFRQDVPDIIKMDIEGAEVFAFDGMRKLFSTGVPIIFLEFHRKFIDALDSQGEERMLSILRENGYEIYNHFGKVVNFSASRVILSTPERAQDIEFDLDCSFGGYSIPLDFSSKFSRFYSGIQQLEDSGLKVVIYGNGSVGKTIRAVIPGSVVATVDIGSSLDVSVSESASPQKSYSLNSLSKLSFDYILVSVLGREEEIVRMLVNTYDVSPQNILCFRIGEERSLLI